jgi:hypothetical protein
MSELKVKISPSASRPIEPLNAAQIAVNTETNSAITQDKIPLTVRNRLRVLRVAPPIDDGFRPFRVF